MNTQPRQNRPRVRVVRHADPFANEFESAAYGMALTLRDSGYPVDFSAPSLLEIDRFFDEHASNGEAVPGGLLSENREQQLLALGAYVGEVIRLGLGGEWENAESGLRPGTKLKLQLANGSFCWPIEQVNKRLKEGADASVAAYAYDLGLPVRKRPPVFGLTAKLIVLTCLVLGAILGWSLGVVGVRDHEPEVAAEPKVRDEDARALRQAVREGKAGEAFNRLFPEEHRAFVEEQKANAEDQRP